VKYTARLPRENVNVSKGSPLTDLALMLAAATAIVVGLYAGLGFAVDWVAPRISYETELSMGRLFNSHPLLRKARPAAPEIQAMAEAIRTGVTDIPFPVQVLVRPDDSINAFAVPGGRIVLTRGILSAIGSQNELAFILGHELGHISHRDHLRGLGRGLVLVALSTFLKAGDSIGSSLGDMAELTNMAFSRRQETLADEAGQDALMARFGQVNGAAQVFEHLANKDGGSYLSRFALSHPETRARLEHLQERAAERGYPEGPLTPLAPRPADTALPSA